MSSLLVRTGVASGESVSVIKLADRRDGSIEKDWVFQREVEAALYLDEYPSGTASGTRGVE